VVTLMRNGYLTFHMPPRLAYLTSNACQYAFVISLHINPESNPIDLAIRQTTSFSIVAIVVHRHDCDTHNCLFILII